MKKKILILNYGLHISGVSRTLINFANILAKNGYDVTIQLEVNDFTLAKELDSRIRCKLLIDEWHIFGRRVRGFLRFYELYRRILFHFSASLQYRFTVHEKYDVEIAFNRGAAARIISASTNKESKKLAWVHNDYMRNSNPIAGFSSLEEASKAYSKFDHVICVSNQAEIAFKQKFGDTRNVTTRYNIIDINRIMQCAAEKKIPTNNFTIVAVGRLCEQKNYKLLLDAAAELVRRNRDFSLWIVGDGEQKQELLEYRDKLNLKQVTFWESQENPYPFFSAADLYVSSSIYEGLSTTTIEALILGKPIVVTDCTGMRDIIGDNKCGTIVPFSANSLADAIERMIIDEKFRKYCMAQALIRAKRFAPEKNFKEIEELI